MKRCGDVYNPSTKTILGCSGIARSGSDDIEKAIDECAFANIFDAIEAARKLADLERQGELAVIGLAKLGEL